MGVTAVTSVLGGLSLGTAIQGQREQRKASKKSERLQAQANAVETARASVNRSRARRQAIAKSRIIQAQNTAGAIASGTAGSSAFAGSQASVGSSLSSSLAAENRAFSSGQQTFGLRQRASFTEAAGRRRADAFGSVSSLFGQGAAIAPSFK